MGHRSLTLWMQEAGHSMRTAKEAQEARGRSRTREFTPEQTQLVLGSMLGDACLYQGTIRSNKKDRNLLTVRRLIFAHAEKQLPYLLHKRELLGGGKVYVRKSGHGSNIHVSVVCGKEALRPFAETCLDEEGKKRVTRDWVTRLDWRGVAYWFMDDGHLSINRNRPVVVLHTESFSPEERGILQEFLAGFCGMETRLAPNNSNPDTLMLVSRFKSQAERFIEGVRPYILPCLAYKVRWGA